MALIVTALSPTTDQVRHSALPDVPIFHCRVHGIRKEFVANTPIAKTDSQTPRSRTLGSQVLLSFAWSHRRCCHVHRARTCSVTQRTKELRIRGRSCHGLFANAPVTFAVFSDAAVTTLDPRTLLVGLHWIGWIAYIGFTNAAVSNTLVSQLLLSQTQIRRGCCQAHWSHGRCSRTQDSPTHGYAYRTAHAPVANPELTNPRLRAQVLYTVLSCT